MNTKNIVGVVLAVGILMTGVSVLAENGVGTDTKTLRVSESPKASRILKPALANVACVAAAVSSRERSLDIAVSANTSAIQSAYSVRASALATAYTKTTVADIRKGVKDAWTQFNTSIKTAGKNWRMAQNSAWSSYKGAVRACKDTSGVSDGDNSQREVKGE